MTSKNELRCDFCGLFSLNPVYTVPNSALGMIICKCLNCGLYQSVQTIPESKEKLIVIQSTSSGPEWGNIRYGKEMRLKASVDMIREYTDFDDIYSVLDIGSSRGHFVEWVEDNTEWWIAAIEPDPYIVNYSHKKLDFYGCKFEDVDLKGKQFDLVYLCHTLEHVQSISVMLKKLWEVTKKGGYVYVDVPDVACIWKDDVIEEFFIDKHRFHFDAEILEKVFEHYGFFTSYLTSDGYNLYGIFRKRVLENSSLFDYATTLENNRKKLEAITKKVNELLKRQRVAIWGAGRQFDALVKAGLEVNEIGLLIDDYLWKYMEYVHNRRIHPARELKRYEPDVILVCARAAQDEIVKLARSYAKNVITLKEMME